MNFVTAYIQLAEECRRLEDACPLLDWMLVEYVFRGEKSSRLVEKTEAHVLIGLFLLLFLLFSLGLLSWCGSATSSRGSTTGRSATSTTTWDGSQLA